jgi:hypothetical protein
LTRIPVVRLDPRLPVQWLRRRMQAGQDRRDSVGIAIPILPSADLDRTAEGYRVTVYERDQPLFWPPRP